MTDDRATRGADLRWIEEALRESLARSDRNAERLGALMGQPNITPERINQIQANQNPITGLLSLKQTGTVTDFRNIFETLLGRINFCDSYAISLFIEGLEPVIKEVVKLFKPRTLAHAYALAKLQESTLESLTVELPTTKKPPLMPMPPNTSKPRKGSNSNPGVRTRIDFDERRAKGLCLWCDENYEEGHQCKKKWQQLYVIEVEDDIEEPESLVDSDEFDRTETVVEAEMLDQMPDRIETFTIASLEEVYGPVAAGEVFEIMPVLEIIQAVEFEPLYEATQFKDNLLQSQERFSGVIESDYLLITKDLYIDCKHLNLPYDFDSHGVTYSATNPVFLSSIVGKLVGMNEKFMAFPFMLEVFDKNHERKPNDNILLGNVLHYECWQTDAFVQSKLFDPGIFLVSCYMHLKKFGSLTIKTTEEADECDFTKKDPSGRSVWCDEILMKGMFKTVYKGIVEADGVHIFCTGGTSLRVISQGTQSEIYVSMNDKLGRKLNANSFDPSAFSSKTSPPEENVAKAVHVCHSQPLSMVENAQKASNMISLAEHFDTCVSDHVSETLNKLSEEMIKCMAAISCKLVDPETNVKRLLLLLRAAYNIRGHTITADTIQSSTLGCRMSHIGQWIRLLIPSRKKFKSGDERQACAFEHPVPLLSFAHCSRNHFDSAICASIVLVDDPCLFRLLVMRKNGVVVGLRLTHADKLEGFKEALKLAVTLKFMGDINSLVSWSSSGFGFPCWYILLHGIARTSLNLSLEVKSVLIGVVLLHGVVIDDVTAFHSTSHATSFRGAGHVRILLNSNVQRRNECLELIKGAPSEISEIVPNHCGDFTKEFFVQFHTVAESSDGTPTEQKALAPLRNTCLAQTVGGYVARVTLHVKPFDPGISLAAILLIESRLSVCKTLQWPFASNSVANIDQCLGRPLFSCFVKIWHIAWVSFAKYENTFNDEEAASAIMVLDIVNFTSMYWKISLFEDELVMTDDPYLFRLLIMKKDGVEVSLCLDYADKLRRFKGALNLEVTLAYIGRKLDLIYFHRCFDNTELLAISALRTRLFLWGWY